MPVDTVLELADRALRVPAGRTILKRREYAQMIEAEDVVRLAREEARLIREQAIQQQEQQRRAGFDAGMREARIAMSKYLMEISIRARQYLAELEGRIAASVVIGVKKIVGEFDNRDLVLKIVRRALDTVGHQERIVIRVGPENTALLRERLQEHQKHLGHAEIVSDAKLKGSDCVIETPLGSIHATLEEQVGAITESIEKTVKAREAFHAALISLERTLIDSFTSEGSLEASS